MTSDATAPANDPIAATTTRAVVALSSGEIDMFLPGPLRERLSALLPSARWLDPTAAAPGEWLALLRDLAPQIAVTAWAVPRLPDAASSLRYVCHVTGSLRGVMPRELFVAGVRATNWGGIAAPLVAEHALLLALGALRGITRWPSWLSASGRDDGAAGPLPTRSLRGRPVAIHGFGQIARELVRLLRPFGCDVVAYSPGVPEAFYRQHDVRPVDGLEALAAASDVFITCEALTDRTRGTIDRAVLSKLPEGGVFVNVGRGAIVDEAALAAIAVERRLRVASDVFAVEPLPPDSPLRSVSDALYSPHIAGPTRDWCPQCGAQAVENVARYLRGEPLLNEVTLEQFDRST